MSKILSAGLPLDKSKKVAILIHGRGASASGILGLKDHLHLSDFALLAPEAEGNSWYPYSFMAPDASNEPAYSRAIKQLEEIVQSLYSKGFKSDQIYFIGFSQGACLSLEFAALHAKKYGGVIAFTGGLIGAELRSEKYIGDFASTPIFIGSSKQDFHVPLERIKLSADLLVDLGADVKTLIFEDSDHTIRKEEIDWVNNNILS
ncbi:MAG: dienelactone hydrolase family protein [Algoriphagus sp.]|uniref:alpha/beta hydrolase n=1 Tax=Algoriphagus sp. TaxID=1872435 RepID=UPI002607F0FD|nr:dienelactone hydrolase family protein [Algoriphagus sp.]MDG1279555.1 dienelactone hydrolase family protein [Algoriphagus sp.]